MEEFVKQSSIKRLATVALIVALPLSLTACAKGGNSPSGGTSEEGGGGTLTLWTHNAGNKNELAAIKAIVNDFNASQTKYKVEVQAFPQDSYNQSVVAAAAAKKLPCILDIDGPNVPNWAWAGYLAPLEGMDDTLSKYLPIDRRQVQGQDLLLRLLRRRADDGQPQVDPRASTASAIPTVDKPWTRDEFMAALKKIKDSRRLRLPAGHRDRLHRRVVAVRVLAVPAELRRRPDQPQRLQDRRGRAERAEGGRVGALVPRPGRPTSYIAVEVRHRPGEGLHQRQDRHPLQRHWAAADSRKKFGDDIVFLPPPDFGTGSEDRRRVLAVGHVDQLLPTLRARWTT